MNLREAIKNFQPFECDDWDALCSALVEEYDAETWRTSLVWLLGSIRHMKQFEKMCGSWNVPVRAMWNYQDEREAYKVIRQRKEFKNNIFVKEFEYEFHRAPVVAHQWLQAEVSGSPGLTGITPKETGGTGGRFHMLWSKEQAEAYLKTRTSSIWFQPQEAVIQKVKGRNFQTIDLVYIPPKTWVWGVDAEEMYVEL